MYRVAVVGAGPSGLYAAAALLTSDEPVGVEVLDRLPAPYGLVRYGVAPDHVKMKSVIRVLQRPFDPAELEFLGGVHVGEGGHPARRAARARPRRHPRHRQRGRPRAGHPGEDLAGTLGSGAFVSWYSGHPDSSTSTRRSTRPASPSSGRATSRSTSPGCWPAAADEMALTDVPEPVLERCGRARCATSTSSCAAARST